MDPNALPDDPIGPPVLGRVAPAVTARTEALAGRHARKDWLGSFGTLGTTTPILLDPEDS